MDDNNTIKLGPDDIASLYGHMAAEKKRHEGRVPPEVREKCLSIVGHEGRMISGSKSGYRRWRPRNVAVFNANICTVEHGKVWHGDIDLTFDEPLLRSLAAALGTEIYLLYEMDARFETEHTPAINRYLYKTDGGRGVMGENIAQYVERGRISVRGTRHTRWVYKKKP